MRMRFTPAQEAAIRADNRELLVSAAAGSGKTAVLVERIVRLVVERGVSNRPDADCHLHARCRRRDAGSAWKRA